MHDFRSLRVRRLRRPSSCPMPGLAPTGCSCAGRRSTFVPSLTVPTRRLQLPRAQQLSSRNASPRPPNLQIVGCRFPDVPHPGHAGTRSIRARSCSGKPHHPRMVLADPVRNFRHPAQNATGHPPAPATHVAAAGTPAAHFRTKFARDAQFLLRQAASPDFSREPSWPLPFGRGAPNSAPAELFG